MSSDAGPLWGQIILLAVLIAVNAYFAAAEMAIVSVNKNRIRTIAQEGNRKAEALLKLIDDPNKFLSAIQVVITLAGFLTSAEAAVSFSDDNNLSASVECICLNDFISSLYVSSPNINFPPCFLKLLYQKKIIYQLKFELN